MRKVHRVQKFIGIKIDETYLHFLHNQNLLHLHHAETFIDLPSFITLSLSSAALSGSRARTSVSGSNLCSRRSTLPTRRSPAMSRSNQRHLQHNPCQACAPSPSQSRTTRARSTRPRRRPPRPARSRCRTRAPPHQTHIGSSILTLNIDLEALDR